MAEPWYWSLIANSPYTADLRGAAARDAARSRPYGQTGVAVGDSAGYGAAQDPSLVMSMAPKQSFGEQGPMSSTAEMQSATPSSARTDSGVKGPGFAQYVGTALDLYGIGTGAGDLGQARREADRQAHAQGVAAEAPAPPPSSSRSRRAGRAVGTLAANFIPVVGPYVSAALGTIGSEVDRTNADQYMRQLADLMNQTDVAKAAGLENPDVGISSTDKVQHWLRTIDQGAAGYFGGPVGGIIAGAISGAQDARDQKRAEKKAQAVAAANARKLADFKARYQTLKQRLQPAPTPQPIGDFWIQGVA